MAHIVWYSEQMVLILEEGKKTAQFYSEAPQKYAVWYLDIYMTRNNEILMAYDVNEWDLFNTLTDYLHKMTTALWHFI